MFGLCRLSYRLLDIILLLWQKYTSFQIGLLANQVWEQGMLFGE